MTVTWSLFTILSLIGYTESKCSPTSYYKNCWIRRFPGLYIDVEESQRRGAQLLNFYQEETALKCSRTCCLTRNFSCNLAVFHYNTSQETVNCFHLHCPSLESCILRQRRNAILYNVTKGVDPDLLVFGKSFTTNLLLWPHMASSRLNASEPLASDKRQFNRPPIQPPTPQTPASLHANPLRQHTTPPTHHATSEPPTTKSTLFTEARNPTTMAAPVNMDGGQLYPNDTKGYVSRNHTSGEVPEPGDLSPVWHLAANTLLIAAATCSAVLVGCCCSVVVVVSWRGRKRKKGRYRTSLRGKKGSMRLVKYVIVRESL
ncbi:MANSC domain-containing protein 4 [Alosa pseudoharengus]|uniref:MANSC domain-containing protein 4 n=1 Tax=Alosa pseudoharengus TaxID=34774 RepID=UPI003F8C1C93